MRVVFVTTILTQYRVPFHEGVRERLSQRGIQYELLAGAPSASRATREDTVTLPWMLRLPTHYLGSAGPIWQPILKKIWNCDLAIVTHENKLLANYLAQILGPFRPSRLALWGHGRNFQANSDSLAEVWKRFWATKCDWWFTYTTGTKALIEAYGFPGNRITVFNNAIDTTKLRRQAASITEAELNSRRVQLGISPGPVGVFIGGLHIHKRLQFLIEAAVYVRHEIPNFQLIIVGDGPERATAQKAAALYPWIKFVGALFGREKIEVLKFSDICLMPGLVGLGILDAMAIGLPLVTTNYPFHSPEIEYLRPGVNGVMTDNWQDIEQYAGEVAGLMRDNVRRATLSSEATATASQFTIERMVETFCCGVERALSQPKRQ